MSSQILARKNKALKHAIVDMEPHMTQRAIARRTRIDETRLSRIISGHAFPFPREVKALSRVLGKPVDELFPEDAEELAS